VVEDEAGTFISGNSGNLFVFPPQFKRNKPATVFTAHLDTARDTGTVQVVRHADRVTSDGTTQLGVDNRAGLSILSYLLEFQQELGVHEQNYFCVFTVAEEIGLLGAYHADFSPFIIDAIYVFDSAMRPGNYIAECAGMYLFDVTVEGKAAHSAVSPEKGKNAVQAAAEMIQSVPLGRLEEFTTANIGLVSGGDATNVIPASCTFQGEIRSLSVENIQKYLNVFEHNFQQVAEKKQVKIQFNTKKDFNPYQIEKEEPIRVRLENAMIESGLKPNPVRYTGGSDANVYNEKGVPAINLGIGAQNPHGNDEFMLYKDFESVLRLAVSLLKTKQ
jgi:tripeptide aminopeptidase